MLFVDIIPPDEVIEQEPAPSYLTQEEDVIPDIFDYYDEALDEPSAKTVTCEKEIIIITFNVIINGNDGRIIFQVKINFANRVLVLKHNH